MIRRWYVWMIVNYWCFCRFHMPVVCAWVEDRLKPWQLPQ